MLFPFPQGSLPQIWLSSFDEFNQVFKKISFKAIFFCFYIGIRKWIVLEFTHPNNLLAECFLSDLCTTRIIWKKLRKATYSEFLTKIFLSAFLQYIWSLLSQTLHCMKIDRYWHEISMKRILNSVFASFYSTWIKSIRCGGFECPINGFHVHTRRVRTKIKLIVVFWQFFL